MARTTLKVGGMTCGHCAMAVSNALQGVRGVQDAKVDLQAGKAVVTYDSAQAGPHELVRAVIDEGYTAEQAV